MGVTGADRPQTPPGIAARKGGEPPVAEQVAAPTIGIGAPVACDRQILVIDDRRGMFTDFRPSVVRGYAELGEADAEAVAAYARDLRDRRFPAEEHVFGEAPRGAGRQAAS